MAQRKVRGNGKERTIERKIATFHAVEVGEGIHFQLLNNDFNGKISLTTDANLLRLIDFKVQDGVLIVKSKEGFEIINDAIPFTVKLGSKSLESIRLVNDGQLEGIGTFEFDRLTVDNEGTGSIKMELSANELTVKNRASGSVNLSGNSRVTHVVASGSGTIHLGDLSCFFMDIDSDTSGTIKTNVVNGLDGEHRGSGTIYYKNTDILNIDNQGSGAVKSSIED